MGNSLGAKKTAKVMRVSGEEFKIKAGVEAGQVVKDYPGHVLLESEAVKHYGVRAKPLEPNQELKAKRVYFLVELPKVTIRDSHNNVKVPRRVRSGINMSAKDRLENLMLARRSVSDLSLMKPMSILPEESPDNGTPMRVRMRLPKSEVEKLMKESRDEAEAAEKIVGLCLVKSSGNSVNNNVSGDVNGCRGRREGVREGVKANQKRVSFCPISEGEIQIAVA